MRQSLRDEGVKGDWGGKQRSKSSFFGVFFFCFLVFFNGEICVFLGGSIKKKRIFLWGVLLKMIYFGMVPFHKVFFGGEKCPSGC